MMREFALLYAELDSTTATSRKLEALQGYFARAPGADAAWAVFFLAGGKPRQLVPTKLLRHIAVERAGIDDWLFDECYDAVGDLAETIAHVLPPPLRSSDAGLAEWMERRLLPLRGASPETVKNAMLGFWDELDWRERFLLLKLIGGGFRVGVSRSLVTRALSQVAGLNPTVIAQRLIGWTDGAVLPSEERLLVLLAAEPKLGSIVRGGEPYPFFLANPLQAAPAALGSIDQWQVEWKYDGIRAQLVRRHAQTFLWSRGEDLLSDRFPEISAIALPDGTVIDGEILIWKDAAHAPFADLQKRIGRTAVSAKILAELPAVLVAYDLLECNGVDIRRTAQSERRHLLEGVVASAEVPQLRLAPLVVAKDWAELGATRERSRSLAVEGLMLKAIDGHYGIGRTTGIWWKWKIDPFTVDAVLIYAQSGHGRRASLYTDYTFAVWDADAAGKRTLVPFAKAYSGLTDAEIGKVDAIIRKTTSEKFGPVRSVKPTLVFEIGFEGIARSARHKAGIAVRFPRMLRLREKPVEEADTLDTLKALLGAATPARA